MCTYRLASLTLLWLGKENLFSLLSLYATLGVERRRKSTGVAKNGIGLCQLPVGVGGALRVCSGWDCRDMEVGGKG